VIFYLEISKDIEVSVELKKTKGTHRLKASSKGLNSLNDNFLH